MSGDEVEVMSVSGDCKGGVEVGLFGVFVCYVCKWGLLVVLVGLMIFVFF